jgi:hypothetical protein
VRREEVELFLRDHMVDSFDKCLDDRALYGWMDDIHTNIMEALTALNRAVAARVRGARPDVSTEAELVPLLNCLANGLDHSALFHTKHKLDPLPLRLSRRLDVGVTDCSEESLQVSRSAGQTPNPKPGLNNAHSRAPRVPQDVSGVMTTRHTVVYRWFTYLVAEFAAHCADPLLAARSPARRARARAHV